MFLLFKKNKHEISPEEARLNRLWDMYASGELEEVNYEAYVLCDYESGVNGEGHSGFFFNNESRLPDYDDVLKILLPAGLYDNYSKAYQSYNTEAEEEVCEASDDYFYEHEQEIIDILQTFANAIE